MLISVVGVKFFEHRRCIFAFVKGYLVVDEIFYHFAVLYICYVVWVYLLVFLHYFFINNLVWMLFH